MGVSAYRGGTSGLCGLRFGLWSELFLRPRRWRRSPRVGNLCGFVRLDNWRSCVTVVRETELAIKPKPESGPPSPEEFQRQLMSGVDAACISMQGGPWRGGEDGF